MNSPEDSEGHPVFKNDPIELKGMVYRRVDLTSSDGSVHTGRVVTIDPVSESWVLVEDVDSRAPVVELVFGHSVTSSRTVDRACDDRTCRVIDSLLRAQKVDLSLSPAALRARRDHVTSWLRRHRLPVEVAGDHVTVAGVATLHAPYTAEQCVCANELVLQRLDALLKSMPPVEREADHLPAQSAPPDGHA